MANKFVPHICGKNGVHIPDAGCDDCTKLEMRVETLEGKVDVLEPKVEALEECCLEVRETLASHDTRIRNNADSITNINQQIQSVNNRFNDYYTKSQTYTQAQVDDLISQIQQGTYLEVNTLPATGEPHIIYLVPKQGGGKEQWIYSNDTWVDIGGTDIDLSDYVKVDDVIDMIHPVGDTVIRMDNVNPATLYTGTTWQKISEGRMLIGADGTYALGSTGGNATHTHTNPTTGGSSAANTGGSSAANTGANNGNTGSTTLTAAQSGVPAHSHKHVHYHDNNISGDKTKRYFMMPNGTPYQGMYQVAMGTSGRYAPLWNASGLAAFKETIGGASPGTSPESVDNNTAANASQGHTHTLNNHTHTMAHSHTMAHTHTQGNTGSSSNMPPYLAVNIWIRTA